MENLKIIFTSLTELIAIISMGIAGVLFLAIMYDFFVNDVFMRKTPRKPTYFSSGMNWKCLENVNNF